MIMRLQLGIGSSGKGRRVYVGLRSKILLREKKKKKKKKKKEKKKKRKVRVIHSSYNMSMHLYSTP
jgi:hypothetical protein